VIKSTVVDLGSFYPQVGSRFCTAATRRSTLDVFKHWLKTQTASGHKIAATNVLLFLVSHLLSDKEIVDGMQWESKGKLANPSSLRRMAAVKHVNTTVSDQEQKCIGFGLK